MDVFNTDLLVATHGVAVIDAGPAVPFPVILQIIRSAEFRPPVGQHAFEKNVELHGVAKCFLEPVENGLHGAGGAPIQQVGEEQVGFREVKGQDTFV